MLTFAVQNVFSFSSAIGFFCEIHVREYGFHSTVFANIGEQAPETSAYSAEASIAFLA